MKHKVKKVRPAKDMSDRLAGKATWRVTGPGVNGKRVTREFFGTRQEAEKVSLS